MTVKRLATLHDASGLDASMARAEASFETRQIHDRKDEHLDIVLKRNVGSGTTTTGFDNVRFAHVALPEIALSDVDLSTSFLGRRVQAPILISSMTGGPARSAAINESIARAAQSLGIGFGVGSQRIALETEHSGGIDHRLRRLAPDVPIMANFGAAQLQLWDGPEMARRAVDMIEADALIIHLNPLQEAVQDRGDRNWRGLLTAIEGICRRVDFPIIVKEVGSGISGPLARRLIEAGVSVIDIAGAGGTSWAAVEAERAKTERGKAIASAFRGWGLPTAAALRDVRAMCPKAVVIASGGLQNGVDCAKAIRLGADMTAMAAVVLPYAIEGAAALTAHIEIIIEQLRIVCFCTGSQNLAALRQAELAAPYGGAENDPT